MAIEHHCSLTPRGLSHQQGMSCVTTCLLVVVTGVGGPMVKAALAQSHLLPTLDCLAASSDVGLRARAVAAFGALAGAGLVTEEADKLKWRDRLLGWLCDPDYDMSKGEGVGEQVTRKSSGAGVVQGEREAQGLGSKLLRLGKHLASRAGLKLRSTAGLATSSTEDGSSMGVDYVHGMSSTATADATTSGCFRGGDVDAEALRRSCVTALRGEGCGVMVLCKHHKAVSMSCMFHVVQAACTDSSSASL